MFQLMPKLLVISLYVLLWQISSCDGNQTSTPKDPSIIIFVDDPEKVTCILPSGSSGQCVPITECPSATRQISNGGRPEICRFEGSTPVICCSKNTEFQFDVDACAPTKIADLPIDFLRSQTGSNTEAGAWPWTVAIHLKSKGNRDNPICGGSFITNDAILTSAQCFAKSRVNAEDLVVVAGIDTVEGISSGNVSQEFHIQKIITHENYIFPILYNDIAVLKLKEKVEFVAEIRPICLPPKALHQESFEAFLAIATGTAGIGNKSETQAASIVIPNEGCQEFFKSNATIMKMLPQGLTNKLMCYGGASQGNVVCSGAVGSSLATEDSSLSKYILIGVQSLEADCKQGIPGLSTRITEYIDWIIEKLIT